MRRFAHLPLLAAMALLPESLQAQSSPVTAVDKVADGVWMAQTTKGSNASWFVNGDEVIAVDTGSDAETGKAILEKIQETAGKPVRFVVITHAHGDHAGGVAPFVAAGAAIICQENAAASIAPLVAASPRGKSGLLAISDRLGFFGGPRRVGVYFLGAGHTAGDLFLYLPEDKILFAGDLALGGRKSPYMQSPDVDPKGWENILGRLAQLDVEKLVPGHGALADRQALANAYAYIKKVNELAEMVMSEKVPDDLIEARIRRPNSGVETAAITPELIANVRWVVRAARAKPAAAATPTANPSPKPPAKK